MRMYNLQQENDRDITFIIFWSFKIKYEQIFYDEKSLVNNYPKFYFSRILFFKIIALSEQNLMKFGMELWSLTKLEKKLTLIRNMGPKIIKIDLKSLITEIRTIPDLASMV